MLARYGYPEQSYYQMKKSIKSYISYLGTPRKSGKYYIFYTSFFITRVMTFCEAFVIYNYSAKILNKSPEYRIMIDNFVRLCLVWVCFQVVSREVLLHLIDYYLTSYGTNDTITEFLNNTVVHIMPSMNPDGFNGSSLGDCTGVQGRSVEWSQDKSK